MVLPAVIVLLAFAIFPLIISAYLSLSRFALAPGGFKLTFIGLYNFKRLLFGSQQYHFLGTSSRSAPIALGPAARPASRARPLSGSGRYVRSAASPCSASSAG